MCKTLQDILKHFLIFLMCNHGSRDQWWWAAVGDYGHEFANISHCYLAGAASQHKL